MFGELIDKVLGLEKQLTTNQCSAIKLAMQGHQLLARRAAEAATSETNHASTGSLEMLFLLSSRVLELASVVDDNQRQLRDVRKVLQASNPSTATAALTTQAEVLRGVDELVAVASSIRAQLQSVDRQLNAAV